MAEPRNAVQRSVDIVVIGGGVVGAATALAVARRGVRVALLDRSTAAAATGSSKGAARIYCPAAYPGEAYLEMGLRALERWRAIESQSGEQLLCPTGALTIGKFALEELPSLREAGLEAELLSPAQVGERFDIRIGNDRPLLYQPDAGVIRADRALAALMRLTREAGGELHTEEVAAIAEGDEWLRVETNRGEWRCSAAIVAAGPWSGRLLAAAGIDVPLSGSRQSVAYFGLHDPSARPAAIMEFDGDQPFALWDPEHGLKAALHARGPLVDPDGPVLGADTTAIDRITEWVGERLPAAAPRVRATETCVYTNTPDERFILERRGRVVVASACNGQGFQFAPETGERAARLALAPAEVAVP
jgi:sarcosine oxidase